MVAPPFFRHAQCAPERIISLRDRLCSPGNTHVKGYLVMPRTSQRPSLWVGRRTETSSDTPGASRASCGSSSSHVRSWAALLAVVVIVGLAGVGFHTLATRGGAPAKAAVATATSTKPASSVVKNQWIAGASLATTNAPILAPSNPQVIYQLPSPSTPVRRSADGGKDWQSYPLPEHLAAGVNLYVSPLDANTVFLSARYLTPPQDGAQCLETPEARPPAAGYDCVAQWVSHDGGAHWRTPRLPLGAPLADIAPPFWTGAPEFVQAQGQSLVGALYCYRPLCDNTEYRIVTSADGGLSWHFADADIAAGRHGVCDIAPVTNSATIFAVSADISCTTALAGMAPSGIAPLTLWRSDDAGQHWSRIGVLPTAVGGHLLVEPDPANGQPLLYGNMFASVDGGNTWHAAPRAGLPTQVQTQILGVRRDGSVLVGALPVNVAAGQSVTETIYRWHPGDTAWQQVGLPLPSFVKNLTVTRDPSGQEALWVTLPMGPFSAAKPGQPAVPARYQVESLFD